MIGRFWEELVRLDGSPCRLLECGSRRQPGQPPGAGSQAKEHRSDVDVVGLDQQSGEGVDFVADLHDLRGVGTGSFDAVLCCSVLEHVRRPWVVAEQLARVTRPGGVLYCQTHQFAFPTHLWPNDYFRFSADGLAEVFSRDVGWDRVDAGHEFPALVVPLTNAWAHGAKGWNFQADETFLNSWIFCRRA